jgi:hypothetical protein
VQRIGFDSEHERFGIRAIDNTRIDSPLAAELRDLKTVQSVNNARAAFLHQDRRELHRSCCVRQQPDMSGIRSFLAQMEPGHQRAYRYANLGELLNHCHVIGITAIGGGAIGYFS